MGQNSKRVRAKMPVFVLFLLRPGWTGKDLSVIQKQLILKNKLDLLCSHLQRRKKHRLLWLTYLFASSAQGDASSHLGFVKPNTPYFHTDLFLYSSMSSGTGTNTKQNKISVVPNSASWNLIHSRHTWTPTEQGCTQEQQVLQAYQGQAPRGLPKGAFPHPSQHDWKAACPKANRQNSP